MIMENISAAAANLWWSTWDRTKPFNYKLNDGVWITPSGAAVWSSQPFGHSGEWTINTLEPEKNDVIHAPKHYVVTLKSGATIECIDVIESLDLGYHLGNAMKYVWRAGRKDATKKIEDLEKAVAFINRKIGLLREAP